MNSRNGKNWTINECLQLQREFELLKLSIDEISDRHQRTPNAIMFKLNQEKLADYNVLYSNYYNLNSQMPTQQNEDEYISDTSHDASDLKHHVLRLEKQLNYLTEQMLNSHIKG